METIEVTIISTADSSQRYHILSRTQAYSCQDVDDPEFYTPELVFAREFTSLLRSGHSTNSSD